MTIEITPIGKDALKAAAEKGYAWLLESGPLYGLDVRAIDTDTLDVGSSCTCVLGQLGGRSDFEVTLDQIAAMMLHSREASQEWAQEHGFLINRHSLAEGLTVREYYMLPDSDALLIHQVLTKRYEDLTQAWCEVIAERAQPEGA